MQVGDKFRCIQSGKYLLVNDTSGFINKGEIIYLKSLKGNKYTFAKVEDSSFEFDVNGYAIFNDVFGEFFEPYRKPTNKIKLKRNPGCYNAQTEYRLLKVGEVITWETETPTEYIYKEYGDVYNFIDKRDCEPLYE